MFDVWVTLGIGITAFLLRIAEFPIAPLLIGYVLSGQLEYRISQVIVSKGTTPLHVFMLDHPIALVLFGIAIFLLLAPMFKIFRKDDFACKP